MGGARWLVFKNILKTRINIPLHKLRTRAKKQRHPNSKTHNKIQHKHSASAMQSRQSKLKKFPPPTKIHKRASPQIIAGKHKRPNTGMQHQDKIRHGCPQMQGDWMYGEKQAKKYWSKLIIVAIICEEYTSAGQRSGASWERAHQASCCEETYIQF